MFAVVRHPDIDTVGVIPEAALEAHQARGWYRVSDWREAPADFYLPEFDEATEDLDAPPKPKKAPAKPAIDDEEQEA